MPKHLQNKASRVLVIGDVHGCYDPLYEVLRQADCTEKNGVITPPSGTYIEYAGDNLDRGSNVPKTMCTIRDQVRRGVASFTLGNHEINYLTISILLNTFGKIGRAEMKTFGLTDSHLGGSQGSYAQLTKEMGKNTPELLEVISFFKRCRLSSQNTNVRVAHALWKKENVKLLNDLQDIEPTLPLLVQLMETRLGKSLTQIYQEKNSESYQQVHKFVRANLPKKFDAHKILDGIQAVECITGTTVAKALTETTKGLVFNTDELGLIAPEVAAVDKGALTSRNTKRTDARVAPWAIAGTDTGWIENLNDVLLVRDDYLKDRLHDPKAVAQQVALNYMLGYNPDERPLFYGHYHLDREPFVVNAHETCLDFKKHVTGYLHAAGDKHLSITNLIAVPT